MGLKKNKGTSGAAPKGSSGTKGDDSSNHENDEVTDDEIPGGDDEEGDDEDPEGDEGDEGDKDEEKEQKVSHSTYQKLLKEKKARDAKIKEFEEKESLRTKKSREEEESKARESKNHKRLLEIRDEEKNELLKKFEASEKGRMELKDRVDRGLKMRSFLTSLNVQIDPKFYTLVDLDDVLIDEESGEVDQGSAARAAKIFAKQYPELLSTKKKPLPNDAGSKGGAGKLSYDEWLELPAKEMKARRKDVVDK